MKKIVCDNYDAMCRLVADRILDAVRSNPRAVLGLATGSTPIGVYELLAEAYRAGTVDFSEVVTFNLDEYYPISPDNRQSYWYYMQQNFFSKVNVRPENIHIPDGSAADAALACRAYEAAIEAAGGIDLQLLGIGQNGHIGFNEPGKELYAATHVTPLTEQTLRDNARFFSADEVMPTQALTVGVGTILKAKSILLLANGKNKKAAVARLDDGMLDPAVPATFLLGHRDVTVICDREAV